MASQSHERYASDPTSEAEMSPSEGEAQEPDRATLSRALHELEAAKARVERHAHEIYDETRTRLVKELFPVLDNIDRTIAAAEAGGDAPAVLQGVRMVRAQLLHVLERYGVGRIDAPPGQPFDPAIHEAVSVIAVSHRDRDRVVIDQLEAGYAFGDRLLRPAKVVVGRYGGTYH